MELSAIVTRLDLSRENGLEAKHGSMRTYATHGFEELDIWFLTTNPRKPCIWFELGSRRRNYERSVHEVTMEQLQWQVYITIGND